LMNNEGVTSHRRARSLNFGESDRNQFYLLLLFVLFGSRACHMWQNYESLKRLNTLLRRKQFRPVSAPPTRP
jgi:hypothetical protein